MSSGSGYVVASSSSEYPGSGYGEHSYETSSSHDGYQIASTTPGSTSGAPYPTSSSDQYGSYPSVGGYPAGSAEGAYGGYPVASGAGGYGVHPPFPSGSGGYGAYPASSSAGYGEYPGESSSVHSQHGASSTPCSTPVAGYPSGSSDFSGYPAPSRSGGYEAYTSAPAVTSKPSYGGNSASEDTTVTTITSSYNPVHLSPVINHNKAEYVDVCSTGLTTITITTLKTVCPVCSTNASPTSSGVPEGWYTSVTVCGHCGPQTTTVTLTKLIETGSYAVPTRPASSYHFEPPTESVPAAPSSSSASSYTHIPAESAPATHPSGSGNPSYSAPAESIPAAYPSVLSHSKEPAESTPAPQPSGSTYLPQKHESTEGEQGTATNTIYQYITLTISPVPYTSSAAPYKPANNTAVYVPTSAASGTGLWPVPSSTHVPEQFEGGASRLNVGMSVAAVLAVGLLAL
jgi:chitinase